MYNQQCNFVLTAVVSSSVQTVNYLKQPRVFTYSILTSEILWTHFNWPKQLTVVSTWLPLCRCSFCQQNHSSTSTSITSSLQRMCSNFYSSTAECGMHEQYQICCVKRNWLYHTIWYTIWRLDKNDTTSQMLQAGLSLFSGIPEPNWNCRVLSNFTVHWSLYVPPV